MIAIKVHSSFDAQQWRTLVEDCGGHPLHFPATYLPDHRSRDLRYLVVEDGDRPLGCGLGIKRARRILGLTIGDRTLTLPTALALGKMESGRKAEVYHCLVAMAQSLGYTRLTIQRNWGDDLSSCPALVESVVNKGLDFTIDLTKSIGDILAAMDKYHRRNIRRAERSCIEIVQDRSIEALLQLRSLQECSAARAGDKGNRFTISDEKFFRRIHQHLYCDGPGDIFFARAQDEYVAGLAYLTGAGRGITVRSGANAAANELYAMYLLQFVLIERLKDAGIRELNIGAVPFEASEPSHAQHGLYKFKRGFGGTPHVRTAIELDLK